MVIQHSQGSSLPSGWKPLYCDYGELEAIQGPGHKEAPAAAGVYVFHFPGDACSRRTGYLEQEAISKLLPEFREWPILLWLIHRPAVVSEVDKAAAVSEAAGTFCQYFCKQCFICPGKCSL